MLFKEKSLDPILNYSGGSGLLPGAIWARESSHDVAVQAGDRPYATSISIMDGIRALV